MTDIKNKIQQLYELFDLNTCAKTLSNKQFITLFKYIFMLNIVSLATFYTHGGITVVTNENKYISIEPDDIENTICSLYTYLMRQNLLLKPEIEYIKKCLLEP